MLFLIYLQKNISLIIEKFYFFSLHLALDRPIFNYFQLNFQKILIMVSVVWLYEIFVKVLVLKEVIHFFRDIVNIVNILLRRCYWFFAHLSRFYRSGVHLHGKKELTLNQENIITKIQMIQYFLEPRKYFLSQRNVLDWRKYISFIQVHFLKTR